MKCSGKNREKGIVIRWIEAGPPCRKVVFEVVYSIDTQLQTVCLTFSKRRMLWLFFKEKNYVYIASNFTMSWYMCREVVTVFLQSNDINEE